MLDTNYTIMQNGTVLRLPLTLDRAGGSSYIVHAAALACSVDESAIILLFLSQRLGNLHTFLTHSRLESEDLAFTSIGAYVTLPQYRVYRGVILQLPCPLKFETSDTSQLQRHMMTLRAEVSYLSLREVRVGIPSTRRRVIPYRQRRRCLHLIATEERTLRSDGLEFQIPPYVLCGLEERYAFIQITSNSSNPREGLILFAFHQACLSPLQTQRPESY